MQYDDSTIELVEDGFIDDSIVDDCFNCFKNGNTDKGFSLLYRLFRFRIKVRYSRILRLPINCTVADFVSDCIVRFTVGLNSENNQFCIEKSTKGSFVYYVDCCIKTTLIQNNSNKRSLALGLLLESGLYNDDDEEHNYFETTLMTYPEQYEQIHFNEISRYIESVSTLIKSDKLAIVFIEKVLFKSKDSEVLEKYPSVFRNLKAVDNAFQRVNELQNKTPALKECRDRIRREILT